MQAAIDAACEALGKGDFRPTAGLLDTVPGCSDWSQETHARLYLAEKLLELLPESCELSTLRPISEAGDVPAGCVRVFAMYHKITGKWLFSVTHSGDTHCADIFPPAAEAEKPDPYAELKAAHAGGKVIQYIQDGIWRDFTDSRGPAYSDAPDRYRIKPSPENFIAHGKTWTRHTPGDPIPCDPKARICIIDLKGSCFTESGDAYFPRTASINVWDNTSAWRYADEPTPEEPLNVKEWTPKVGDVVTLRSGGPKMTVLDTHPTCYCAWFADGDGEFYSNNFPTATLIPA